MKGWIRLKDWLMEHKVYAIIFVIIAIGSGYYFFQQENQQLISSPTNTTNQNVELKEKEETAKVQEETAKVQEETVQKSEPLMVDIKGQIHQPGVYTANAGDRVIDVISRAGGFTELADQSQVNLAQHIQDEMIIYIPAMGEQGTDSTVVASGGGTVSAGQGQKQGKININKADATELENLPGIGPSKAAAIIEYRETSGPFKTPEDLKNISGIGDKTYEKLKDLVAVQ
ncbi:helix-hairpin-helix domain-containing protein [Neobacillus dielmonensis]|uniref:helix-hairpin-helix domain-containing protein n=1 Tax=Neobacillus dielmonensis TaxID=1347369 RepID=UPI001F2CA973|nr:helix-hairpin-helix domain-containing protein [Neobacillus dielmonensis]